MLDSSSLSMISLLVDLDFHNSLIKTRSGLQTSHCLKILRPSYRAVITIVVKQTPTKTETRNRINLSLTSNQYGIDVIWFELFQNCTAVRKQNDDEKIAEMESSNKISMSCQIRCSYTDPFMQGRSQKKLMTEAMSMEDLWPRQSVHGWGLFLGIKSVYNDYKQQKWKKLPRQVPRLACY